MTASKMNAVNAKNAKAAAKKAVAQKSVEVAAEAKLLAADAEASASAGSSAPLMATFAAAAAEAGAEGASGSSGGGMGSTALILGGIAVAGGVAAAAAGGGSDNDDLKVVEAPKVDPVYSVTASSATAKEGPAEAATSSVVFSVSGGNSEARGTTVQYKITGVDASDIDIPLEGSVQVNNDNSGSLRVTFKEDAKTEGLEKMKIVIAGKEFTVDVEDASKEVLPAQRTFTLTTGTDVVEANVINAPRVLVAGTGYVNTLDDDDKLTGAGTNPTLNVTFGAENDISDSSVVHPELVGIAEVNVKWQDGDTSVLNLADADAALKEVNVVSATSGTGSRASTIEEMGASVTSISLNDATRVGDFTFDWREEVLTGTAETLTFDVSNARVKAVSLTEGGDAGADQGNFFETINLNSVGTNDLDAVTIQANGREDVVAGNAADTTKQTLNIKADAAAGATGSLEINALNISGVDTMSIEVNQRVDIAADKAAALSAVNDGISSSDLEALTITGGANVMIDGLEGRVSTAKVKAGLTVDASKLTGNLRLGVVSANAADEYLSVTSGTGNDEIETYGPLGGDIVTNAGNDTVRVTNTSAAQAAVDAQQTVYETALNAYNDALANNTGSVSALLASVNAALVTLNEKRAELAAVATPGNMAATASISTGDGADTVTTANLLAVADPQSAGNQTFGEALAASITTGAGNDTVTIYSLDSAADYSNGASLLAQWDDLTYIKGATVDAGAGDDTITFGIVKEGASIEAGDGNDTINVNLFIAGSTILAADTDADKVSLATATAAGNTSEVGLNGSVDRLGAVVSGGAGNDTFNFTEVETITDPTGTGSPNAPAEDGSATYTLVDRDAELRGGAGTDTISVTALDAVTVTVSTTMADQDTIATGTQTDINANVTGVENLKLTIANQIVDDTDDDAVLNVALNKKPNDTNATDGAFTVDVLRFDSDLATIALTSQEQVMETAVTTEVYQAGTATAFTLNNLREGIALSLAAHEATGVTAAGAIADDALFGINTTTGVVTQDVVAATGVALGGAASATDVTLTINYDQSAELNDSASVTIGGVADSLSGDYDVDFVIGSAATDTTDDAASSSDDNADLVEHFTINVTDAKAHSFDLGGFGDNNFSGAAGDGTNASVNSLTVNTDGSEVRVQNVGTDTIRFNNAAGTAVTAANVTLIVDQANNYTITTGSGADVIDMRADTVRSDDNVSAADVADYINAGAGRDILIVNGSNDLSGHDLDLGSAGATLLTDVATVINDDVFKTISGVEVLMVDANTGGDADNNIVLDEMAAATGIDTIRLVDSDGTAGSDDHTMRLVIGNNFSVAATAANGELTAASSALVIDASKHTSLTNLEIENKDDDTDIATVNLDIRVTSQGGTDIRLGDLGTAASTTEIRVTAQEAVATDIDASDAVDGALGADADGTVDILVDSGEAIAKIVMVDSAASATPATERALEVSIEADWTGTAFEFDASALLDTDKDAATGGLDFVIEAGDTATYTVSGTQNSDEISGSAQADTLSGNAGNDILYGLDGADTIVGGTGNDVIAGEYIPANADAFAAVARQLKYDFTGLDVGEVVTLEWNGVTYTGTFLNDTDTDGAGGEDTDTDGLDGNIDDIFTAFLAAASLTDATVTTAGGDNSNTTFSGDVNITFGVGKDLSVLPAATISTGIGIVARSITAAGSLGHIDLDFALKADVLTGGAGSDTFHFTVDKDQNMLTSATAIMDTVTDLNLNEDTIELVEANLAGTAVQSLAIGSVVNNGAAINIDAYGDTLTQAINDMFSTGREFDADETGIAGLVQYKGESYLVALGSQEQGQFGSDDYIVKVTGYTGTLSAYNFTSANDTIAGTTAADVLLGRAGNDTIDGLGGNDTIRGGAGDDSITLGAGNDTVVFDTLVGADTIVDFNVTDDSIQLSKAIFDGLGAVGALTAAEFVSGAGVIAAADETDRLIYNTTDGKLYYDADGSATGSAAVLVATFTGAPVLTLTDFSVIA